MSLRLKVYCVLFVLSDDDMISIGSMMSLSEGYYLDDNDDDMEVAPSPRLRHKRNLSSGNIKVPGICLTIFVQGNRRYGYGCRLLYNY